MLALAEVLERFRNGQQIETAPSRIFAASFGRVDDLEVHALAHWFPLVEFTNVDIVRAFRIRSRFAPPLGSNRANQAPEERNNKMAKQKKKWQTQKETKLRAEVNRALKVAEDLLLDLKKVKRDMMSKFPSYSGPPYSNCPPSARKRRRR